MERQEDSPKKGKRKKKSADDAPEKDETEPDQRADLSDLFDHDAGNAGLF